jgi:hypothetical protein
MFGKLHSAETLVKFYGKNNPMFGRRDNLHPMYGKSPFAETHALSSEVQGTAIFVFSLDNRFVNSFSSAREAGLFFNCSHTIILRYVKNNK